MILLPNVSSIASQAWHAYDAAALRLNAMYGAPAGDPQSRMDQSLETARRWHDFVDAYSASSSVEWDAAFTAYEQARLAEQLYDRTIAVPAWERHAQGDDVPEVDAITEESDRLTDERVRFEMALMALPAPNAEAIAWKVQNHRLRYEQDIYREDHWDMILADLRQLGGVAS